MSSHHGMEALKGIEAFCYRVHADQRGNRFGRIFSELPPLYMDPQALHDLGAKQIGGQPGPMNGGAGANRTNAVNGVTAGHVFFGQFVDHDITLDLSSSLEATADFNDVTNVRTPTLDLDCVYGLGPEASGYLYYSDNSPFKQAKLLTAADGTAAPGQPPALAQHDLCRTPQGTAIIGDFRNDENRIISQLQLAMIKFHNHVCAKLHDDTGLEGKKLYEEARQLCTWHYQWVVITDFLVNMCGLPVVADILGNGRHFYCDTPGQSPFIPIEFSVAAYRFGHSMVPQSLQVQPGGNTFDLFGNTLGLGFTPLNDPDAVVDWNELVDTGSGAVVQRAEKLDSKLAERLLELSFIDPPPKDIPSLASRNLLRGQVFLLPSGESVARAMAPAIGLSEAQINQVTIAAQANAGTIDLSRGTPLWYYILMETEEIGRETSPGNFDPGEGLGPVGARLVAETIIGLIELDERSLLGTNRNWRPVADGLGQVTTLGEMLTYTYP